MLGELPHRGRLTIGGDKNYDTRDFVGQTRKMYVTPHVAQDPDTEGGPARLTVGRPGIPATPSANASGSSSSKRSAG